MAKVHDNRIDEIFMRHVGQRDIKLSWKTTAEAEEQLKHVELLMSELRSLKRQVRSEHQQNSSHIAWQLDDSVHEIDAIIFQLALAGMQIRKQKYEKGNCVLN